MKQILLTIFSMLCLVICILLSGIMLCMLYPPITENICKFTTSIDNNNKDQLVDVANKTRAYVAGEISKSDLNKATESLKSTNLAFDTKSIAHLDDVRNLFDNLKIAFGICGVGAAIFLVLLLIFCGKTPFGKTLCRSSFLTILIMILAAIWAILDFNSMFNWLHSLFFIADSWLFDSSSLLITMYPTNFWIGMGIVCVACSIIVSIIILLIGKIIK